MTTSRERREAVAKALYVRDYAAVEAYPGEASETWDRYTDTSGIRTRYLAMADAALAAALPDRTVFTVLLDNIMVWSRAVGADATDEVAAMLRDAGIERLFALVYADDAQAGDQEGAEHE